MTTPTPVEELTAREQQVLELLRAGLTNGEIAPRLEISRDGAKYHVSEIIGKLGVRNRRETAMWPERPPWWMGAAVPMGFLFRKLTAGPVSAAAGAGAFALVLAGIAVLVLGLTQTGGGGSDAPSTARLNATRVLIGGTIDSISSQGLVLRDWDGNLVPIRVEEAEGPAAQFCRQRTRPNFCEVLSDAAPQPGEEVCVVSQVTTAGEFLAWSVLLESQCTSEALE